MATSNMRGSTVRSLPTAGRGEWWFRLTAPQEPENATLAQREAVRQGRLASITTVFISIYTALPLPVALTTSGASGFLAVLVITLLINAFALFVLNRMGYRAAAGWLVVTVLEVGFALSFLSIPQGVSLVILPAFGLMAAALMVVVAFFRPSSIFVVLFINMLFTIGWIYFGRHTSDISLLLRTTPYTLIYPSLGLHLFVSVIGFFWVTSAKNAIAHLDRSQEIVELERRELEMQEQELVLKQQLEDGIKQIQQTHVRVANGDFTARAPLTRENVLWQIAYSLNNLLARLQNYSLLQNEMRKTQEAVEDLSSRVRFAKSNRQPIRLPSRTGTMLDSLLVELTTFPQFSLDQPQASTPPQRSFDRAPHTNSPALRGASLSHLPGSDV